MADSGGQECRFQPESTMLGAWEFEMVLHR